jgi:hypothetical protein
MTEITGRDGWIVQQALMYFIAVQDALPSEWQDTTDMLDAVRLVRSELFDTAEMAKIGLANGLQKLTVVRYSELKQGPLERLPTARQVAEEAAGQPFALAHRVACERLAELTQRDKARR